MFEMYGARKPTSSYGTRKSRLFSMGKKGGNNDLCDHLALFQLPVPIGAITNTYAYTYVLINKLENPCLVCNNIYT